MTHKTTFQGYSANFEGESFMITVYTYDNTFEGFLTCVYESYYFKEKPEEIISMSDYVPNLIYNTIIIQTDTVKSDKVISAISEKISSAALRSIFYVYISSIPGSDTLLYKYIRLGFKLGKDIDLYLHNDIVLNIHKIIRKVTIESHNMLGFIRFKEIGPNMFYASIEPDHNILSLLAPHFSQRLASQNWIIHDLKREAAAFYNCKEWIITEFKREEAKAFESLENSNTYEVLWREYFNSIAIKERKNPRLQSRLMPRRYWNHLTEFENSNT
jgi:probable DNA metabolism protein